MKNPYRRVVLRHGSVEAIANLPDVGLRRGYRLTLVGHEMGDVEWDVAWVSSHAREKSSLQIDWHNNI